MESKDSSSSKVQMAFLTFFGKEAGNFMSELLCGMVINYRVSTPPGKS